MIRQYYGFRPCRINSFIVLALLIFSSHVFAYETKTEYVQASKYYETVQAEISQAKQSIKVYMYLVSLSGDEQNSQVYKLLDSLVQAKARGINVQVVLDQTLNFGQEQNEESILQSKNQRAYEFLKANNIPVFFDEAENYTHAKAIIVDDETVIFGSTNWSKTALAKNHEANALIKDREFAKALLEDLASVKIQEAVPYTVTAKVPILKSFLLKKKLLGEMVSESDDRAFDIMLYLYKISSENADKSVALDYDELAKSLGIENMSIEDYRRQINKVLDKLESKYGLIKFEKPGRNQNAEIKLIKGKDEEQIFLPTDYWRYDWNKELSLSGKVVYLINLSFTQDHRSWSMSRKQLADTFNVSESFISQGTMELRRKNLLEVQYDDLEAGRYSERLASTYTPREFYDPNETKAKLKTLEQKHGKEKLDRAAQGAATVFEDDNLKTIEYLLDLETQYGEAVVSEALKKIGDKNPDNPKRSAAYLINTIKSIAKDQKPILQ